jgi:hypothetical protein
MWDIVGSSWTSSLEDALRKTPTTFNVLELLGYISRFSAFPSPPVLRHIHPILKRVTGMDGPTAVIPQAERQQDRRNAHFLPAPKLSKVFGRSASQTLTQSASCDNLSSSTSIISPPRSPSTTISKGGRRKSQRVVSPQVVASILDGMYAYPINRESNRHSPTKYRDKASLHHGASVGTVASGICRYSFL